MQRQVLAATRNQVDAKLLFERHGPALEDLSKWIPVEDEETIETFRRITVK